MGTITIDGRKVEFTDEKNLLTIIRKAGIDIPTLCYHSELSTFGACRLCTVEDDRGRTFASCSEEPRDGMVIYTNTGKLKRYSHIQIQQIHVRHVRCCSTSVSIGAIIPAAALDGEVSALVYDSRKVTKDCMFVCIKGAVYDSHEHTEEIAAAGAKVIVAERPVKVPEGVTLVLVDDSRYVG